MRGGKQSEGVLGGELAKVGAKLLVLVERAGRLQQGVVHIDGVGVGVQVEHDLDGGRTVAMLDLVE